ncbi:non-canonical purine NTP pyrophosphatase [Terriglobus saanensis]|uniref:dITP/XTP pyrophosphatase n=1 Tax=Terriglobus saanensis (strain ATCC BAA-1853 / DSM 23119 / SP1PR4) TaxID=401053 RepID=E8V8E3_TERSS|nr:non-canonical purine NTP pyrophosphatase [Terriglobus saanensis]ADV81846.1 non-canonical purine NTP pyrophosphatase, rdgB/HAM1 family [Terriglobus saanensis SP1PR4]
MPVLYIASTNAGKLRDFRAAAEVFGVDIEPLPGLKEIPAPDETEKSFEGNARLKAEFYSALALGKLVLADDSGLEVDMLGGAPGVRSARYADDSGFVFEGTVDQRNNACLLAALGDEVDRRGRYRCVLVLARDGAVVDVSEGSVEGEILGAPVGEGGFGYDPLFWLPDRGLTMAELDDAEKQRVSHRGRALVGILSRL